MSKKLDTVEFHGEIKELRQKPSADPQTGARSSTVTVPITCEFDPELWRALGVLTNAGRVVVQIAAEQGTLPI